MRRSTLTTAGLAVLMLLLPVEAELPPAFREMNRPHPPFRIAGNLYYVGTNEIAVFLFATSEGHILLDGGFAESAPLIRRSIAQLGFEVEDVRVLLNSHAHLDHAGGLADLERRTGATLVASRGDAPLLRAGGEAGFPFPAVEPDRLIGDGESVSLGGTTLTARVTAGHTPGCTTWTTRLRDGDRTHDVVFVCSVNALDGIDLLATDAAYPDGRAEAFRRSFETLEALPCDIFLGAHASFFRMQAKLAERAPGSNPFVDPELYRRHVAAKRRNFEERLARQQAGATPRSGP
jgi:metallo-beta-lactamase class B